MKKLPITNTNSHLNKSNVDVGRKIATASAQLMKRNQKAYKELANK